MSFVKTAEVAGYLQTTDDQKYAEAVDMAEALVASHLGTDYLLEEEVTVSVILGRQKDSFELEDGPVDSIDSISSITVDGTAEDLTDWKMLTHWGLKKNEELSSGATVVVVYTKGWHEEDSVQESNLPWLIRKAIIRLAGARAKRPDSQLKSERIGDYAYTLADTGDDGEVSLPKDVETLLQRWRRQ